MRETQREAWAAIQSEPTYMPGVLDPVCRPVLLGVRTRLETEMNLCESFVCEPCVPRDSSVPSSVLCSLVEDLSVGEVGKGLELHATGQLRKQQPEARGSGANGSSRMMSQRCWLTG